MLILTRVLTDCISQSYSCEIWMTQPCIKLSIFEHVINVSQTPEDLWVNHSKFVTPKPHMRSSPAWKAMLKVHIHTLIINISGFVFTHLWRLEPSWCPHRGKFNYYYFCDRWGAVDKNWDSSTSSPSNLSAQGILEGLLHNLHHLPIILQCCPVPIISQWMWH